VRLVFEASTTNVYQEIESQSAEVMCSTPLRATHAFCHIVTMRSSSSNNTDQRRNLIATDSINLH